MRPNTEGCTEWSCPFHGLDNRTKHMHTEACPIRSYSGPLNHVNGARLAVAPECKCEVYREESGRVW